MLCGNGVYNLTVYFWWVGMQAIQFKLFGYRTQLQPEFFLLALFYLYSGRGNPLWYNLVFVGVVFVSILVHELGHALAITNRGYKVNRIAVHGFGGDVTGNFGYAKPKDQLMISISGPLAGLLLGLPFLIVSMLGIFDQDYVVKNVIGIIVWVNIGWSLFNLLPMMPLDGGHAFTSILRIFRVADAKRVAGLVGIVTGGVIVVAGLSLQMLFVTIIGAFCAYTSFLQYAKPR